MVDVGFYDTIAIARERLNAVLAEAEKPLLARASDTEMVQRIDAALDEIHSALLLVPDVDVITMSNDVPYAARVLSCE